VIKQAFLTTSLHYSGDNQLIAHLWSEIEKHYSDKKRHYHTLTHLDNLLYQLNDVKDLIQDWDTIVFSVAYHDVVYNALKHDNEEKSALFAQRSLQKLSVSWPQIEHCMAQIIATKSHQISDNTDTNLLTDADLSVLGQDWPIYQQYYQQVRKEYSIYPDFVYKPGRKKVLRHFLEMEHIFKTEAFAQRLETQARHNMKQELSELSR
jgi:predicted metal-dependent HD superfamily phosphohydrolase